MILIIFQIWLAHHWSESNFTTGLKALFNNVPLKSSELHGSTCYQCLWYGVNMKQWKKYPSKASLDVLHPFCRPKFWSCVNIIISNRMITKNFSGSEKVRNCFLALKQYSLLLSNVTPIITSRLGLAAQYGVNALNWSYCIVWDDHTLRICSRILSGRKKKLYK